jgi:hypothetical protein
LAFWVLEATTNLHQMRYYPRMGDIKVTAHHARDVVATGTPRLADAAVAVAARDAAVCSRDAA